MVAKQPSHALAASTASTALSHGSANSAAGRVCILARPINRQYRSLIDEPVPMLGDISPRAASKTARGRKILVVWLKHLENHSRRAEDRNDPMATYDFTWLWRELKVQHLRN